MPSTPITNCPYRTAIPGNPRWSFCRHPRVHLANQLVDARICSICLQREMPFEQLRPVPDRPLARPVEPFVTESTQYISTEQLLADTRALLGRLPANLSAVAGIPRSGMIPAAVIATYLHIPLFELGSAGLRPIGHGLRLQSGAPFHGPLLVIDDSVYNGTALKHARQALQQPGFSTPVIFAALYPRPETSSAVDLYARLVPEPHLFEWNLFNCNQTVWFAFDFDGILCGDWAGGAEEGEEYREFLRRAPPHWLPRRRSVPLVVTARLEKHRDLTEQWLRQHGVKVDCLVMGPWRDTAERSRADVGAFKGRHYAFSDCRLFLESDSRQAHTIFSVSGKPVLCPETGELLR